MLERNGHIMVEEDEGMRLGWAIEDWWLRICFPRLI